MDADKLRAVRGRQHNANQLKGDSMASTTLASEIQNDPLSRGYNTTGGAGGGPMTDKEVANDLNTVYRDGAADGNILVQYFLTEVHRTNTGTDTDRLTLWHRKTLVQNASPGEDVFGSNPANPADKIAIAAADSINRLLDTDVRELITNLNDNRYAQLLDALADADIMSQAQADELKTLSTNKQTRGQELAQQPGSDSPSRVREGDVAEARKLP